MNHVPPGCCTGSTLTSGSHTHLQGTLNVHIILASWPSLHIDEAAFGRGFRHIQEISLQDYDGETNADIRHFLAHELQRVVQSRKLSPGDVPQWPSPRQMDDLAGEVGNSFLCASIAMKYIAYPRKHPAFRLDAFLSSPDATAVAYANLDHTYQDIIRDNRALIRHLIDIMNLAQPLPRSQLLQFFPPDHSERLNLTLEEFSPILVVSPDQPTIPIRSLSFITLRVLRKPDALSPTLHRLYRDP
ncbi:hypothetical protein EDB19DRAFT_351046 [Suillus lakei]|nr:hypothetical protein EDB19DRAFT_351046 [Suillus lakei]